MLETITRVNEMVNGVVWGPVGLSLLFGVGLLMTVRTGFFQVGHFGYWMKNTIGAIFTNKQITAHTTKEDRAISQFQSLCTALAATIGTGNIVGVATAIISGGPGAIFWMWVMAILGMMTNYSENVLGIFYRRKNADGEWSGGAMYYLADGLGGKKGCKTLGRVLAVLFSCFCVLASFGIGNMSQINSIAGNMNSAFGLSNVVTGIALVVLTSGFVDLDTGKMPSDVQGSALVGQAFSTVFGHYGPKFIAVSILLFAYSTVLGWSHYGTKAFEYLFGTKASFGYKVVFVGMILVGATMKLGLAWDLSDTFNGLMMLPNLIGVLALSGTVAKITRNYIDRKLHGKDVAPLWSAFEEYQKAEEAEAAAEEQLDKAVNE